MTSENKSIVIKAGIWYTIANFLTKGAMFLTTPVFTRIMSAADIGTFANMSSWQQVLLPIVTLDLATSLGLARFDYRNELNQYTSSILVIGSAFTCILYGMVVLNMGFFEELFSLDRFAIHIMFIYMMLYPAMQMFQSVNMFEFRYIANAATSIGSFLLSVCLALLLTMTSKNNKLAARIIGNYVPLILFCFVIYIYIICKGKKISFKYLKYAVAIAFPMIWHSVAIHLLGTGDRLIITRVLGKEANALYTVAFTTGNIANMLWYSMNSAWSPWSTERMDKGETDVMRKASYGYTLFYFLMILLLLLVAPEVLFIMGGKKYVEAIYVLPPVIVGCMCQFLYSMYVNAEFYLKKQTRIALSTLTAAGLNIGLNILLVPKFGYVAAAYTTLFGYFFLLIFHYISLKLLKKEKWYDNRFHFLMLVISLMLVPMCNYLYSHAIARYIVFSIGMIICMRLVIRYRNKIVKFMRGVI